MSFDILQAGARTYSLDDIFEAGKNHGLNLLQEYPPDDWHDCRPSIQQNRAYFRGYKAGLRVRWSPVFLVQCVTHGIEKQRLDYMMGDGFARNRFATEARRKLAKEIREMRADGRLDRKDNRDIFARIMSEDYPHTSGQRDFMRGHESK